jgi:hypothetical protein
MKKRSLLLVILTFAAGLGAAAQTRDIALTAGISVPMYKGIDGDVLMGVSYSRYGASGLGWRAGFQYGLQVAEVDNIFGFPIAFGYRTPSRSGTDRLFAGAIGAADAAVDNAFFGRAINTGNVLTSFLINLFSDVEFFAGVTPAWIAGPSSTVATSWTTLYQEEIVEDSWTEKRRPVTLTLDAGMCINYSIWRFDLKLMPAFHFDPFAPLVARTEQKLEDRVIPGETPLRWFFTFSGGLGFRF